MLKLRVLTNQNLTISYNSQNLLQQKSLQQKKKELNFFGLLLRYSKDFLTPNYNVILHIHGGENVSQSVQSHISYLSNWADKTESVIISIDYSANNDGNNKFPTLINNCWKIYQTLVTYSAKLFNFNINKLIIYGDSTASLIIFDIIKNCELNNLKKPDSVILICPTLHIDPSKSDNSFENLLSDEMPEIYECEHNITKEKLCLEDIENMTTNDEMDDKQDILNLLNFDKENDDSIFNNFPSCYIISSMNDPYQQYCQNLYNMLKKNNVKVELKEMMCYYKGYLNLSSLIMQNNDIMVDYALEYVLKEFDKKNNENINDNLYNKINNSDEKFSILSHSTSYSNLKIN